MSASRSRRPCTRSCKPRSGRVRTSAVNSDGATATASGSGRSRDRLARLRSRCLVPLSSGAPAGKNGTLSAPLAAEAQAPPKVPRVGYLSIGSASDPRRAALFGAVRQGLSDLGYVEGKNIIIEARFAEGDYDRLPGLAAELVRLKVDVIVAYATPTTQAAKNATRTIPIVMAAVIDPVATGLVAGLGRPGGNVTGLSLMAPELIGKQMQLLKELVPKVSRVAVLWNPANPGNVPQLREAEVAARALGVRLQPPGGA